MLDREPTTTYQKGYSVTISTNVITIYVTALNA